MKGFYRGVIDNSRKIIAGFTFAALICAVLYSAVEVNYDMTDYLPDDAQSTVSLEVMEEGFHGGIPNARVMVQDVTISEALGYKEEIEKCRGVTEVTWLDDAADILQPVETMEEDTLETYYKDDTALFSVTIEEGKQTYAEKDIRKVIGDENAMSGEAISTAVATEGTVSEIGKVTVIAVIFLFIILMITTSAWIEPVLIMLGLGVAIIINSGSNIIFGEISFVTSAAGAVLQLAVSLDYSVFLIHRFEECLEEETDPKEAMLMALQRATSSILSSGATTVIGFLALIFMQFKIGPDLGLSLAKGIAISLITVFTFMPALTLDAYKWCERTGHRDFLPSFRRFGKFVCRIMIPMVCLFAVLIVPSYLASGSNEFYYGSSHIYGEGMQLGEDTERIERIYGKRDTYVAMVPRGDQATEESLSKDLHKLPQVKEVISYMDTVGTEIPMEYLDEDTLAQLVSEEHSRFIITVDVPYESEETFDLVEDIRDIMGKYYPDEYYLAGSGVSTYDLMDTITADTITVNMIAIAAVFLVLMFIMRSFSLPVILVLAIETAIWINLAIPYFKGYTVFYISYLIVSSVQLGATVDYAILLTERYMEMRRDMDKRQAVIETLTAVTPSIITSGSVLAIVGILLGQFSSHGILSQLGTFIGVGSILSTVIVLFVLPGLLCILDKAIRCTTWKIKFYDPNKEGIVHEKNQENFIHSALCHTRSQYRSSIFCNRNR